MVGMPCRASMPRLALVRMPAVAGIGRWRLQIGLRGHVLRGRLSGFLQPAIITRGDGGGRGPGEGRGGRDQAGDHDRQCDDFRHGSSLDRGHKPAYHEERRWERLVASFPTAADAPRALMFKSASAKIVKSAPRSAG